MDNDDGLGDDAAAEIYDLDSYRVSVSSDSPIEEIINTINLLGDSLAEVGDAVVKNAQIINRLSAHVATLTKITQMMLAREES